jgi:hypothetical protein
MSGLRKPSSARGRLAHALPDHRVGRVGEAALHDPQQVVGHDVAIAGLGAQAAQATRQEVVVGIQRADPGGAAGGDGDVAGCGRPAARGELDDLQPAGPVVGGAGALGGAVARPVDDQDHLAGLRFGQGRADRSFNGALGVVGGDDHAHVRRRHAHGVPPPRRRMDRGSASKCACAAKVLRRRDVFRKARNR